jgi:hypothetical protein
MEQQGVTGQNKTGETTNPDDLAFSANGCGTLCQDVCSPHNSE